MKKIMMNKYGFERWQEEDFSDDGNRFTCYKAGERVRVSKLVSNGRVFISARIDGDKLPYEEYSILPSYKELDKLNRIDLEDLTDEHLYTLYESCLAYEQEYTDAENMIVMPTLEDIIKHCKYIQGLRRVEIASIEQNIKNNITELLSKATEYQWKDIKYYYNLLCGKLSYYDESTYPQTVIGTRQSLYLCKADFSDKKESYYYRRLLELINSVRGAK